MPATPVEDVVVDSSVLLAYIRRDAGEHQATVDELFDRIVEGDVGFFLLDLSVYEILNVLVRRHGVAADEVGSVISDLLALADEVVRVTQPLAAASSTVAEATGLSGYDAAFLAAGRATGSAVVTLDDRLIEAGALHPSLLSGREVG